MAQETADSITYAYNRANSDYDYLTLNQNKFYTWDVRDTNYYTVVLEDGTSLSAADMPENVSFLQRIFPAAADTMAICGTQSWTAWS
ncbi:MAG: hypothetical protein ACLTXT_00105 [Ruminococcus callidus]